MRSTWLGFLMVLAAAFLWGMAGTTARVLFVKFDAAAIDLVSIRLWFSGLLLTGWLVVRRPAMLRVARQDWGALILFGLLGMALLQFTYLFAIERTNVATAIFLEYQAPILVAAYAALAGTQRITGSHWLFLAVAAVGSVLLVLGSATGLKLDWLGVGSGIVAAAMMAFHSVYPAGRLRHIAPAPLLGLGLLIGALGWSMISPPWRWLSLGLAPATWGGMVYIAVFGTVVPFLLYLAALRRIDSAEAVLIASSEPVIASVTAFLVLGETLTPLQIGGCALILLAIAALQLLGLRRQAGLQSTVSPEGS